MRRAQAARELLDNVLLREAIAAIEADILQQMRMVKLDDADAHTRLVLALQTAGAVNRRLWHLIQDGNAALEQINLRGKRID